MSALELRAADHAALVTGAAARGRAPRAGTRLAALAAAVVVLITLGIELAVLFRVPDAGFSCREVAPTCIIAIVAPGGVAARAGLREGDELLALDGTPWSDTEAIGGRVRSVAPGDEVRLLVRQGDGQLREVMLRFEVAPLQAVLSAPPAQEGVADAARAVLVLLVAAGVALARPEATGARALLACGTAAASTIALSPPLFGSLAGRLGIPIAGQADALTVLACCAALHLFLVIPAEHPLLARLDAAIPRLLRGVVGGVKLVYAFPLAMAAAFLAMPIPEQGVFDIYFVGMSGLVAALVALALLALGWSYRHPPTPLARAQLRWIFVAMVPVVAGMAGAWAWTLASGSTGPAPELFGMVTGNAAILVFVAIGLAVLRYRLFDVDRLLRLTIVWVLLAGLLLVGFLTLTFLGSRAAVAIAGPAAAADPSASVLAALVVAAGAYPIHRWLLGIIDRLVFRERIARRRLLEEAGTLLGRAQPPDVVAAFLTRQAPRRLGLMQAWVGLAPAAELVAESTPSLTVAPPQVVERFTRVVDPVLLAPTHEADAYGGVAVLPAEDPAVAPWFEAGARVLVPLRADRPQETADPPDRRGLVGLWVLGTRPSGDVLSREDLVALQRIGALAAVLLAAHAEVQERERVEQELRLARVIQQTLLPATPPRVEGWCLTAYYEPARIVAGDFYDFLVLPDGRLGLVVGDVSGKGMPAALLMASTQSILRTVARSTTAPGAVLAQTNALLRARLPERAFVTCQYAILDPPTGTVQYANAGHCPPLWQRGGETLELSASGLPLGVVADATYAEMELVLGPGQGLLLYSDGVVETHSPAHELFGFERLGRLVAAAAGEPDLPALIRAELSRFRASDGPPEDDLTLLLLQRAPYARPHSSSTSPMRFRLIPEL